MSLHQQLLHAQAEKALSQSGHESSRSRERALKQSSSHRRTASLSHSGVPNISVSESTTPVQSSHSSRSAPPSKSNSRVLSRDDIDGVGVCVAVKIRPLSNKLDSRGAIFVHDGKQVIAGSGSTATQFVYDAVYGEDGREPHLLYPQCVEGLVDGLFKGYNATVFAYGQTGSGKTYTMGSEYHPEKQSTEGVIPEAIRSIFAHIEETKDSQTCTMRVAFVEIHKEEVRDLLIPANGVRPQVSIRESSGGEVSLSGATEIKVDSEEQMAAVLQMGTTCRATASTGMNDTSSRSHAIFTITLQLEGLDGDQGINDCLCAKMNFVDLAGSERVKRTKAEGARMQEGIHINQGLLSLGNVINAIVDNQKHVRYRDSKLTRLLQDSLGGNSRTCMIACISPAEVNYEETLNTLRYADRARHIRNRPKINRDPAASQAQLRQMLTKAQNEIAMLRRALGKEGQESGEYVDVDEMDGRSPSQQTQRRSLDAQGKKSQQHRVSVGSSNQQLQQQNTALEHSNSQLQQKNSALDLINQELQQQNSNVELSNSQLTSQVEELRRELASVNGQPASVQAANHIVRPELLDKSCMTDEWILAETEIEGMRRNNNIFIRFAQRIQKSDEPLSDIFKRLDPNGKGFLTADDVGGLVRTVCPDASDVDADHVAIMLDLDGDYKVTLAELQKALQEFSDIEKAVLEGRDDSNFMPTLCKYLSDNEEWFRRYFKIADTTGKGALSHKEVVGFVNNIPELHPHERKHLVSFFYQLGAPGGLKFDRMLYAVRTFKVGPVPMMNQPSQRKRSNMVSILIESQNRRLSSSSSTFSMEPLSPGTVQSHRQQKALATGRQTVSESMAAHQQRMKAAPGQMTQEISSSSPKEQGALKALLSFGRQ